MKKWPKNPTETVYFDDLTSPVKKALMFVLKNGGKKIADDVVIPYKGYNIGKKDLVCSFDPVTKLSPERRAYDRDEQGRDIFDLLIGVAVQLGIEQGRRLTRNMQVLPIGRARRNATRLKELLDAGKVELAKEYADLIIEELDFLKEW